MSQKAHNSSVGVILKMYPHIKREYSFLHAICDALYGVTLIIGLGVIVVTLDLGVVIIP